MESTTTRNLHQHQHQHTRTQLVAELAARGSTRTGLKAVLQRRLHGLLVEAALESRREEAEAEQGEEAGEGTRDTAGAAAARGCSREGGLGQPANLTEPRGPRRAGRFDGNLTGYI
jgi:hypothetical protein